MPDAEVAEEMSRLRVSAPKAALTFRKPPMLVKGCVSNPAMRRARGFRGGAPGSKSQKENVTNN